MNPIQRIARNSAAPIVTQLINKVVDFGFALVVYRALGTIGAGEYAFAVLVWLYAKTFTDFGLATLTTRDVARDQALAGRYLGMTTLLRLLLWLVTIPIVGLFTFAFRQGGGLSAASTIAIGLLLLSIAPDSFSDAANAIFNAFERMDIPAGLTFAKNVLKVAIGLTLLWQGLGVPGLALTALLTNLVTAGIFGLLLRRLGVRPVWALPGAVARSMLIDSWPLFLNALLAGLFFRSDTFVLKPTRGDAEVGIYDAAYKFLNLVLLIPQYFTLALFPHLSRLAATRDTAFGTTYTLALKLLVVIALPLVVATTILAPDLIWLLAGPQFLPDAGTALRILIWFLPLSYVNGLIQYVLIASGFQRSLIPAFALTAGFNLIANLIFTPQYGFRAAALITIGSEIVLLAPFLWFLHRRVGHLPPLSLALRPGLAAAAMGGVAWLIERGAGQQVGGPLIPWLATIGGGLVYLVVLVGVGGISATERRLVLRLIGRAA